MDNLAMISEQEKPAFEAFIYCFGSSGDVFTDVQNFQERFNGEFSDEKDFAYYLVEECFQLEDFAKNYFDYAKFARDLFICDYTYHEGYVFSNL